MLSLFPSPVTYQQLPLPLPPKQVVHQQPGTECGHRCFLSLRGLSAGVGGEAVVGTMAASFLLWRSSVPPLGPGHTPWLHRARAGLGWGAAILPLSCMGQVSHKTKCPRHHTTILINLDMVLIKPEPQHPGFVAQLQVDKTWSLSC